MTWISPSETASRASCPSGLWLSRRAKGRVLMKRHPRTSCTHNDIQQGKTKEQLRVQGVKEMALFVLVAQ